MSSILLSITSIKIEYKLYTFLVALRMNERTPNESSKKLDYQCKEIKIYTQNINMHARLHAYSSRIQHTHRLQLFSQTFSSQTNNVLHVNTFNIIILYRKISKLLDSFNPDELFRLNYLFWVHCFDIYSVMTRAGMHFLQLLQQHALRTKIESVATRFRTVVHTNGVVCVCLCVHVLYFVFVLLSAC